MRSLLPFFTYYGGKWRVAPKYPQPLHRRIIEPFAGSAGYSLRHSGGDVWLNDLDPAVAATWRYLISVKEDDILSLPDVQKDQTVDDLHVSQEARLLIGWWLNKGSATPKKRPSTFMLSHPRGGPYWGEGVRRRIASQLSHVRHWRVTNLSYEELPDLEATWFIDPPYSVEGRHYRHGSSAIDYGVLARWSQGRTGQAIVCESDDADWLPFRPLALMDGTEGAQKQRRARLETIWTRE